jgi:hypothetical protein
LGWFGAAAGHHGDQRVPCVPGVPGAIPKVRVLPDRVGKHRYRHLALIV